MTTEHHIPDDTHTDPAGVVRARVRSFLKRWRKRSGAGPGIVVGVSGGGDSVALLRAIAGEAEGLGLVVSVAHLHHGSRGTEADLDAEFVAGLAEGLGLPIDLGRWKSDRPGHFEADAREARYAWLAEKARSRGASAVAVGHSSDDQAETVLHRVVRGTGIRGLAGIPRTRPLSRGVTLVRPLLSTTRDEARDFLRAIGQEWREDASNVDLDRTRALIRLELLPSLAKINPRVAEALGRLARVSRGTTRLATERAGELARSVTVTVGPGGVVVRRPRLASLPRAARAEVFRLLWHRAGWPERSMSADRWDRMASLVTSPRGRHAVGAGIDLILGDDEARLVPSDRLRSGESAPPPTPIRLPIPGTARWAGVEISAGSEREGEDHPPGTERIDLGAVDPFIGPAGPYLVVGGPVPGDRFGPLGMGGRSMPMADFLRSRRVPPANRPLVPVVRDRKGPIWVVGHRIADRVRRTEKTGSILVLRSDGEGDPD